MLRVLEPEVMDTAEEAADYDAMDFAAANGLFARDAIALLGGRVGARVLDIGVGTGQIPALMFAECMNLEMVAVDLAEAMLVVARARLDAAGLSSRCRVEKMDAKALDLPDASFDLVACNSMIHHIPDPAAAFREIARVVKPGGAIIVRDLIRPPTLEDAERIVERVAGGDNPRQKGLFFDSLRAALEVDEVSAMVRAAGLSDLRVERCSDRHWTAERAAR
jgi:SAM-dependent methyltransferase